MSATILDFRPPPSLSTSPEIIRRGMKRTVRLSIALVIGFFVLIVGSAAFIPMGGAIIGAGEVQTQSQISEISHPTGGVIADLPVKEGDHVRKGDILLRFDDRVSSANAEFSGMSVVQLLAVRARLEAEQLGRPAILFPEELTKSQAPSARAAMEDQQRLFALQHQRNGSLRNQYADRIRQYEQDIVSARHQSAAIERQLALIGPERAGLQQLWEKKLVSLSRLNQVERSVAELKGQQGSLNAQISQSRARISEVREQIANLSQTSRSEAGDHLMAVNAQLNEQRIQAASATDSQDRSTVRAPYSGIVENLAFATIGSFVPPAQKIVTIVPDEERLEVAVRIDPADIDQIRPGQEARVRFSAFSAPSTPEAVGKLIFISADRTQDERTGAAYYRARVSLAAASLPDDPAMKLKPGMPAEVFIGTGKRTMLSYITKPLRDQFARAFLEN